MSGFDGRIIFEGDTARCKQLLGVAIKHASVLRQNKNILGQPHAAKAFNLGGGASCTVIDMKHMRIMRIVAPTFPSFELIIPPEEGVEGFGPEVFDVLAGLTATARIENVTIPDAQGKPRVVPYLTHFSPTHRTNARYPDALYRQRRLAVDENSIFAPIDDLTPVRWSEHAHCKPSNYTGLMRPVVQVLMGLGKVLKPLASEKMKLPPLPEFGTDVITGDTIPMETFFVTNDDKQGAFIPRVNFDYRWPKTHGVTFDQDGVPWVVEVAMRGVHAMRLYMDPASMTKEGRAQWLKVSPELTDFLDVFPGIPLGITLPTFEDFDKQKRAGEVIQLISEMDMRTAYGKSMMSNDTGWAFSPTGKEAHNTCWEYGEDTVKRGYHYGLSFNFVNERFKAWTPKRAALAAKFSKLYERNKCLRMSENDAGGILAAYERSDEAGYREFDGLKVSPTLNASAKMSLHRSGKLFHGAKFAFQPQIKFPEEMIGGVMSFDFSSSPRVNHKVKCDTPMYVCYTRGVLDVICYYFDNTRSLSNEASYTSGRQQCQTMGSWTDVSTVGGDVELQGNFYSNRWDHRRERTSGQTTISKYTSEKITAYPLWEQKHPFSSSFLLRTEVAFYLDSVTTVVPVPPVRELSVCVPMHDRSAYFMGVLDTTYPSHITYRGSTYILQAKIMEEWELFHFIFAWFGSVGCPQDEWVDKGPLGCWGRKRCVYVNEDACPDDYALGGFWLQACVPTPPGSNWVMGPVWDRPVLPSGYEIIVPDDKGKTECNIYFVNDTPYGETIIKHEVDTYEGGTSMSSWWWKASPAEDGSFPTFQTVNSCLGEHVTNTMDDFDGNLKHLSTLEYMFANWNCCYTGVIE